MTVYIHRHLYTYTSIYRLRDGEISRFRVRDTLGLYIKACTNTEGDIVFLRPDTLQSKSVSKVEFALPPPLLCIIIDTQLAHYADVMMITDQLIQARLEQDHLIHKDHFYALKEYSLNRCRQGEEEQQGCGHMYMYICIYAYPSFRRIQS